MKTRFFYAPHKFKTWPKLYVLTEDGKLYCEFLNYMRPDTDIKNVDFENFKASDYQPQGYQDLQEISNEEALRKTLTRQANWISRYLRENNVQSSTSTSIKDSTAEFERILRGSYFRACSEMDKGFHGPEVKNGMLYMSIYHYLEYTMKGPRNYETFDLGGYLTGQSNGDYLVCKYECQDFEINKFNLDLLKSEENNFEDFLK